MRRGYRQQGRRCVGLAADSQRRIVGSFGHIGIPISDGLQQPRRRPLLSRQALQLLDRAQAQIRKPRRQGSLDDLGGLVLLPRPQGPQRLGPHLGRFVFQRVAQQRIYLRGALAVGSQLNQAIQAAHADVFVTGLQRRIGHCQHVGAADLGIGL